MKTLLSVLTTAALTLSAIAIPQTFGNNGFFAAAGQQFEDFAGQAGAFGAAAEMKGKWAPAGASTHIVGNMGKVSHVKDEELKLSLDAVVFGIPAAEIRAVKSNKAVHTYIVRYSAVDDKKRGIQTTKLRMRVLAAVSAYTGESVELAKPIRFKGIKIEVKPGNNDDVSVSFSR